MKQFTAKDLKLIEAVKAEMFVKFLRIIKKEFTSGSQSERLLLINIVEQLYKEV